MGTFTVYKESLFSENLRKVTYSANAGDVVTVTISIYWKYGSGGEVIEESQISHLVTIPASGYIDINIADILRPFKKSTINIASGEVVYGQWASLDITAVNIQDPDAYTHSWGRRYLIIGGYDDNLATAPSEEDIKERMFHTARPQIDDTVPGLYQSLTTPINSDLDEEIPYTTKILKAKVWFRHENPQTIEIAVAGGKTAIANYVVFPADFNTVQAAAIKAGATDEIVAYDLTGVVHDYEYDDYISNCPYPQRFIVRRPRGEWSYFLFQNRLSGIDTLIARGRTKVSEEGEPETFMNDGREYEINNDSKTYYQTNTGYIRSREYRDMWFDFFKSPLHYRTWLDGDIREIILDEWTAEYDDGGELNSFTFKWHFADRERVKVSARGELEDYYQEIPAV